MVFPSSGGKSRRVIESREKRSDTVKPVKKEKERERNEEVDDDAVHFVLGVGLYLYAKIAALRGDA